MLFSLSHYISVQYCYTYLVDQIPVGLLLYSHIPTAIVALLFGIYVLVKARNLPSLMLFATCASFAVWSFLDLTSWFAFLGSANTMFVWSLLDLFGLLMFFNAYYFLYTFVTGNDLPLWQKIVGFMFLLPTAIMTFLGKSLTYYDADACAAIENDTISKYPYFFEALFILAILLFCFYQYRKISAPDARRRMILAGLGVVTFLTFFFSSTFLVNLLAASDASTYVYNYEIYGLFGMPILLVYLGYLIVRYHAFDLKVFSVQALLIGLIVLISSEFAFVQSQTNIFLVATTLLFTVIVGYVLFRSVKKEILLREQIQLLAKNLEITNKNQEGLLHFITHEIKGYLTKSQAGFAAITEGDYGPVSPELNAMASAALADVKAGVATVMEILSAANMKKGTMTYSKTPFDFKVAVLESIKALTPSAEEKHLTINNKIAWEGSYIITGDVENISKHVVRNLIDNAIRYTPAGGFITVELSRTNTIIRLVVEDCGVGITKEDMALLFTEGGHGKDSIKVNVHSTGYGLFIAKQIIDKHSGKIWAESAGAGKGSRFIVELPVA